jgi:DNA-binding transcriptional LysR family regulator
MLRYTLRQIEFATRAADLGSVAAAAQALGVAQPSVSAAIRKLEDQLGLQLFIRQHAQGIRPTPQGAKFLAEARSLLSHANEFQRDVRAAGAQISGELAIGSFSTFAPLHMPRLIAGFRASYPEVRLKLEEGAQEDLVGGLRSGRFDLALLYKVDMPDDLRVVPLRQLDPYVVLPANHALARKRSVRCRELADEPFILLDIQPSRTYFLRVLASLGIVPRIAFSSPSLELVRGLVGQGLGYSLLITRPAGDHSYDGGPLAIRPLSEATEKGVLALAMLKQKRPTRLVATFETFCRSYFRSLDE